MSSDFVKIKWDIGSGKVAIWVTCWKMSEDHIFTLLLILKKEATMNFVVGTILAVPKCVWVGIWSLGFQWLQLLFLPQLLASETLALRLIQTVLISLSSREDERVNRNWLNPEICYKILECKNELMYHEPKYKDIKVLCKLSDIYWEEKPWMFAHVKLY